ncbi:MAG: DUF4249 domain-containing protein [Flammeovirgaceae bacterium]|nr:MAG: DUF4249 domain-containing protein [Flammeovirgaceae bacterium]
MKAVTKIALLAAAAIYWACETVVFPDLNPATPVLVVDAWITNKAESQLIKLTKTQPYFENTLPPGVSGAQVEIEDNEGNLFVFEESDTLAGLYVWTPGSGEVFGETGRTYTLRITAEGETYTSITRMGRVPPVDSITFRKEPGNQFVTDLYLAEFWATDPLESGDTYWIKTYKNSTLLNKPSELNLAYDAGFSKGGNFSGLVFIAPIRTGINPFDQDEKGSILSPYVVGDSLYVEIHSLSEASFDFLNQVALQTDRPGGFAELFATPLANVSTNINNVNPTGMKAVGFFNVAAVSGLGRKFASLDDVTDPD